MRYCPVCKACYEDADERCYKDQVYLVEAFPGTRLVDSKYYIESLIGQGGMGTVYRATHVELERAVALKVVLPDYVSNGETLERFRREARAAARLNHPNVITIYDFGIMPNGRAYLAMEVLSGYSLREEIERSGLLSPQRTLEIMRPVCEAVQAAHNAGIIHRDLKPDNIVIEKTENDQELVKVVDFGIAKLRGAYDIKAMNLTGPGLVMGTPHYMSPEQCKGEELDARSDVYNLGVMLYEMLAGHVPFDAPTPSAVIIQHAIDPPRRLTHFCPNISSSLEAVVLRALAKDRQSRQQSAMQLCNELDAAISVARLAQTSAPSLAVSSAPPLPPPSPSTKSAIATPRDLNPMQDTLMAPEEPAFLPARESRHSSSLEDVYLVDNASSKSTIEEAVSDLDSEMSEILAHTADIKMPTAKLNALAVLQGHEHIVKTVGYTPDSRYLISASADGQIKIWDLTKKRACGSLQGHELSVNALVVAPGGELLASCSSDGTVRIWEISQEREIFGWGGYSGALRSMAFSPSGRRLAITNEADIEIWDIIMRQRVAVLKGHVRLIEAVDFSRDGNTLVSGGVDEIVRFWDIQKGMAAGAVACIGHCINSVATSVDGILATGGKDYTIRLWDISSRAEIAVLEGHADSVRTLAFSPRGDYLVSGDWSGNVKLWDAALGVELASVEAHEGAVMSVSFSRDERQVATAGYDHLIKLWQVDSLQDSY
jgi:eukaryotic-like serine/threonine-protein kinase